MSKNRKIGMRLTSDIHQFRLKAKGAGAHILAGLIATAPVAAEPKVYRLGFLWGLPPIAEWVAAFDQGLAELAEILSSSTARRTVTSTGCRR